MKVSSVLAVSIMLVALAASLNAVAFKTAAVNNTFSITVAATNNAALALNTASAQDPGVSTAPNAGGQLEMVINDAMQPGSTYCFASVMAITNQATGSPTPPTITIDTPTWQTPLPAGVTIVFSKSTGAGTACGGTILNAGNAASLTLAPNASMDIDMLATLTSGTSLSTSTTPVLTINAHR
jgi:hypothetical protein